MMFTSYDTKIVSLFDNCQIVVVSCWVNSEEMLIDRRFGEIFVFLHYLCIFDAKIGMENAALALSGKIKFHCNETI